MTLDLNTNPYSDSIREVAEEYLKLARSIEEAVRPGRAGRPIDRLRRMAEAAPAAMNNQWAADRIEGLCSDSIAGATSCYLRLVARMMVGAAEAARVNDVRGLSDLQLDIRRLAIEVLECIDRFEQQRVDVGQEVD